MIHILRRLSSHPFKLHRNIALKDRDRDQRVFLQVVWKFTQGITTFGLAIIFPDEISLRALEAVNYKCQIYSA